MSDGVSGKKRDVRTKERGKGRRAKYIVAASLAYITRKRAKEMLMTDGQCLGQSVFISSLIYTQSNEICLPLLSNLAL